jgi:hypothetical protein
MFFITTALLNSGNAVSQDIQPPVFTLDFENGTLSGWESDGGAFINQPTLGDNPTAGQRQSANPQGRYWIGTYENYQGRPGQNRGAIQGNEPTGVLTSETFTIPEGTLSFLIGGSNSFDTRVELNVLDQIEGRIRVEYTSGQGSETMERVVWDLSQFAGSTGQLRIIDESTTGHINVDDFNFSYYQEEVDLFLRADKTEVLVNETFQLAGGVNIESLDLTIYYGDDNAGNFDGQTVEYSYSQLGSYTVQLVAYRGNQVVGDESITINVRTAGLQLNASSLLIKVDEPVSFSAELDPPSPGHMYEFNLGDNTNSGPVASPEMEHRYSNPGQYLVYVVTRGPNGEPSSRSNSLLVTVVETSLTADKSILPEGDTVRFTGYVNPPLDNATYSFTIEDTMFSRSQPDFEYAFRQAGEYEVNFTAMINNRTVSSNPYTVTVHPDFSVGLNAEPSESSPEEPVEFTALGIPPGVDVEYNFHFGDGEESGWTTKVETVHSYTKRGSYNAFVEARLSPNQVFRSSVIAIDIGGFPIWILIVAGLVVFGAGGYLLATRSISAKSGNGTPSPDKVTTTVVPYTDPGTQELTSNSRLQIASEIRIKPVKDIGEQMIETTDNLIIRKRIS